MVLLLFIIVRRIANITESIVASSAEKKQEELFIINKIGKEQSDVRTRK